MKPKYNVMSISEVDHTFLRLVLEDLAVKFSLHAIKDSGSEPIIRAKVLAELMFRLHKIALDGMTPESLHEAYTHEGDAIFSASKLIAIDSELFATIIEEIRVIKTAIKGKGMRKTTEKFSPRWMADQHADSILKKMEYAKEFLFNEADLEEIMKKAKGGVI